MSMESYARGFCKAAESADVNPECLLAFMLKRAEFKGISGGVNKPLASLKPEGKALVSGLRMAGKVPTAAKFPAAAFAGLSLLPAVVGMNRPHRQVRKESPTSAGVIPIVR